MYVTPSSIRLYSFWAKWCLVQPSTHHGADHVFTFHSQNWVRSESAGIRKAWAVDSLAS